MKKIIFNLLFFVLFLSFLPLSVMAQGKDRRLETVVAEVLEQRIVTVSGKNQWYQKLKLTVAKGDSDGKSITLETGTLTASGNNKYEKGDRLLVTASKNPDGSDFYYITDYIRRTPLYILFGLFVVLAALIGRKRGIASLAGLVVSFFVIFKFLLPQILAGQNPVTAAVVASLFIVPITFYSSHGLNRKTTASVIGTLIALIITGALAVFFVEFAKITGLASEEAVFLQNIREGTINIKGLVLAGIIIGTLGVLDDITISQAAIVAQLKQASPRMNFHELYFRSMDVGIDHIASMVNTLVLVYAGAAMPLLLLFVNNPQPFTEVINYEIFAEEAVRTFVSSIGLMSAVPITTLIAAIFFRR